MPRKGPIILIEDDKDDQEVFSDLLQTLGVKNRLKCFPSAEGVIDYLMATTDKPFLIISDVNLPGTSGVELRKKMAENNYLREKSIPFVFLSTSAAPTAVKEAYQMMVQGFFEKPNEYSKFKETIKTMLDYWGLCRHPNME